MSRPGRCGRQAAALGAALLGVAGLVACLLAIRLEVDGFGRPRDSAPRTGYLTLLWLGVVASLGVPIWLARRWLGTRWPAVAGLMAVTAFVCWLVLGL